MVPNVSDYVNAIKAILETLMLEALKQWKVVIPHNIKDEENLLNILDCIKISCMCMGSNLGPTIAVFTMHIWS